MSIKICRVRESYARRVGEIHYQRGPRRDDRQAGKVSGRMAHGGFPVQRVRLARGWSCEFEVSIVY
jgi:hypothetical protein